MLWCGGCKEDKTNDNFCKSGANKTGYQYHCKTCQNENSKRRYHAKLADNPDYKQKKADYDKKRRSVKIGEIRAYDRERAKMPHRKAAHNEDTRKRRARLKDAVPEDYDKEGVMCMYKLAQKISLITGVEMHVDHVIPISKGGEHNTKNLQLLAGVLNVAKGASEDFNLIPWKKYPK